MKLNLFFAALVVVFAAISVHQARELRGLRIRAITAEAFADRSNERCAEALANETSALP